MLLNKKVKITFILPTLSAGGSERVFSFLAQNIDKDRFETTLLVIGKSSNASYEITGIKVHFFEKERVLEGIPLIYKYLKNDKQDVVISVIAHLNTLMAYMSLFFTKTKFIARESTVLGVDRAFSKRAKRITPYSILANKRFNRFDKIICQSEDMLDDLQNHYKVKEEKLILINNPITSEFALKTRPQSIESLKLITIGRLSKEKGIPRILKILSKLTIPFHYTLIGSGPEKEAIDILIKEYNLSEKITLITFTKHVARYLEMNDLFLQGSYYEGFPNALLESCVVGTPVIAFNAPGGTKEIIVNGINGFIVNDEETFLQKLQEKRIWNPEVIKTSVYEKFNEKKIISEYEQLFINVLKN